MSDEIEDSWEDYDSGPFCRHWDDTSCPLVCANCGHRCLQHAAEDGFDNCEECDCEHWVDAAS